jgi:hypothetical protein
LYIDYSSLEENWSILMVNGLFTKPGRGIIPRVNFPDNLYRKYTGNIPEIYRKYTGNIPEIYRKYTEK